MTADFYWLTGLIEGEGTFQKPFPSEPNRPSLTITTTDKDIAERCSALIGTSILIQSRNKKPEHWKDTYWIRARGGRAIALMLALRPYMSLRRQSQIDAALAATKIGDPRQRIDPERIPVLCQLK